jgi:hypothetical protein
MTVPVGWTGLYLAEASVSPAREDKMICYQIELASHLDASWSDWFEAVSLTHLPNGSTWLTFDLPDQAALLGLLLRLHSLRLELICLRRVERQSVMLNVRRYF